MAEELIFYYPKTMPKITDQITQTSGGSSGVPVDLTNATMLLHIMSVESEFGVDSADLTVTATILTPATSGNIEVQLTSGNLVTLWAAGTTFWAEWDADYAGDGSDTETLPFAKILRIVRPIG